MSLDQFISKLKSDGFQLSRPYLFEVWFNFTNSTDETARNIPLLAHSCNLPGWEASSQPVKIYGVAYEMPLEIRYDICQISFYVDRKLKVLDFLKSQRNVIFDETDFSPVYPKGMVGNRTDSNYVFIRIFDTDNRSTVGNVRLHNAFIKNVNSMPLSWSATGQVQQINVTVSFEYMEDEYGSMGIQGASENVGLTNLTNKSNFLSGLFGGVSALNFDTVRELMPDLSTMFNASPTSAFGQLANSAGDIASNAFNTVSDLSASFSNKVVGVTSGSGLTINNSIADNVASFINPFQNATGLPSVQSLSFNSGVIDNVSSIARNTVSTSGFSFFD